MTEEDCKNIDWRSLDSIEGMVMILKLEFFKEEYREAKYQLVKARGGFGCHADKMGNAIFVKELLPNGESYRVERCDNPFIGIATEEAIAEWMELYGKEV